VRRGPDRVQAYRVSALLLRAQFWTLRILSSASSVPTKRKTRRPSRDDAWVAYSRVVTNAGLPPTQHTPETDNAPFVVGCSAMRPLLLVVTVLLAVSCGRDNDETTASPVPTTLLSKLVDGQVPVGLLAQGSAGCTYSSMDTAGFYLASCGRSTLVINLNASQVTPGDRRTKLLWDSLAETPTRVPFAFTTPTQSAYQQTREACELMGGTMIGPACEGTTADRALCEARGGHMIGTVCFDD
jgi:hypothetical protein